ncbi:JAB domain-containing protein, partial [Planktotalea sp.]
NHPSGDPSPSRQDVDMTENVASACEALDVTIHDHVVIGKETEFSFKSEGLLLGCCA